MLPHAPNAIKYTSNLIYFQGIEEIYVSIIKVTYDKSRVYITLSGEELRLFH